MLKQLLNGHNGLLLLVTLNQNNTDLSAISAISRHKSVLFTVRISNSPFFPFNSCFNIVHSLNVLQFNHKTYQQPPKNSVHVIDPHDVTVTVGKTMLCKI